MGVRVAYGNKDKIIPAIEAGIIPKDSIIITNDADESEMFFYDAFGDMKMIAERNHFETMELAQEWIGKYDCAGNIISVRNGDAWTPYIVLQDHTMQPLNESGGSFDVRIIDGGNAVGTD